MPEATEKLLVRLWPCVFVPSLSTARSVTPRSMPIEARGWAIAGTSSASNRTEANHLSAVREMVARLAMPSKRGISRIRTQPMTGSLIRFPSMRKVRTSFAAQKLSPTPFFLHRGQRPRFSKHDRNADLRSMIASCAAHLVTSNIHGKLSRLTSLSRRRSSASVGCGRSGSALRALYMRRHSSSAQL